MGRVPFVAEANVDTTAVCAQLEADGYAIVEGLLAPDVLTEVRGALRPMLDATSVGNNSFLGFRTRRHFGFLTETRALDAMVASPLLGEVTTALVGPHLLSSAVAIRIEDREVAQTLHTDASAWPVPPGGPPVLVNSIWAVDDFTEANGATRLLPGSHRWPADRRPAGEPTVAATMPAGSALLYLGGLWHGGGANTSGAGRTGVVVEYSAAWLRPQENFALSFPPAAARALPPALAALVGYALYPPFVGHAAGRPPEALLAVEDA